MIVSKFKLVDGQPAVLVDTPQEKIMTSRDYTYTFRKSDGLSLRWGRDKQEDGNPMLGLPELADIEVSRACGAGCTFCYKGNVKEGDNMSLETFRKVLSSLPPTVCQVALGIGDIDTHPELFDLMRCAKEEFGIVPNVTINDRKMDGEWASRFASHVGGVAVSFYNYERTCSVVDLLTKAGVPQVKLHCMISQETLQHTWELLTKFKQEPRLQKVRAIVLLSLKKQGRATKGSVGFNPLTIEEFRSIWQYVLQHEIPFGFDSCSAVKLIQAMSQEEKERYGMYVEPCEATLYSVYVNVKGEVHPCSFIEKTDGWHQGISLLDGNDPITRGSYDFLPNVWQHQRIQDFRSKVMQCKKDCKACPVFEI